MRIQRGFPGGSAGKESACNAGDLGSIPGLGRSPGHRVRVMLPLACVVYEVAKSWTLSDFRSSWILNELACLYLEYYLKSSSYVNVSMCRVTLIATIPIDHGIAKSWTWLSDFHFHYCSRERERERERERKHGYISLASLGRRKLRILA